MATDESKSIKDYHVVYNLDRIQLMRTVMDEVAQGWTIQGGIAVTQETQGTAFAQALVLYEGDFVGEEDSDSDEGYY